MAADPVEFKESSGEFEFLGRMYPFWGSVTGRSSTEDYSKGKFNRYAKFGQMADQKLNDLGTLIKLDPGSLDGRCAYATLIMMIYGVRIGNEDSAEGYESGLEKNKGEMVQTYGTTTLLKEHISLKDGAMFLNFLGKEQVEHSIKISEPFLVQTGKKYYKSAKPGHKWIGINYETLFKFVKKKIGKPFVPKDMRTFCANITGWNIIQNYLDKPTKEKKSDAKKDIAEVVEKVAERLGNTPGIAKKNYIDNRMLDWFLNSRWTPKED